jgi:hypothetical protein
MSNIPNSLTLTDIDPRHLTSVTGGQKKSEWSAGVDVNVDKNGIKGSAGVQEKQTSYKACIEYLKSQGSKASPKECKDALGK